MSDRLIAKNKKAYHDFEIIEEFEAGIVLLGTEVKAMRDARVNLKESYARIKNGEVWLEGCHIGAYIHGNRANHDPIRPRKLLLHRRQISKLAGQVTQKGLTLVPLTLYFKGGMAKLKIGLARGKKLYDKRETQRRKAVEREVAAALKRSV